MSSSKPFMGLDGFVWFFGIVEDRQDPLEIGRIRVRAHGFYPIKEDAPTDLLPWAMPIQGIMSAALNSVGASPTGIQVGSSVFGFFLDGRDAQQPVILGTYAGFTDDVSDINTLATGSNNISKVLLGPEPSSQYDATYPFNKVFSTEGGHVIELDDSPGAERIHVFHKSGSYAEISSDGRFVVKSVGDSYNITASDNFTWVGRDQSVTILGKQDNFVLLEQSNTIGGGQTNTIGLSQSTSVGAKQTNTVVGSQVNTVGGAVTEIVLGSHTSDIGVNKSIVVGGAYDLVSASVTFAAGSIKLVGDTTITALSTKVIGLSFTFNGLPVVTSPIVGGSF